MRRRAFLLAAGALAWGTGYGQARPRIGILSPFANTILEPSILQRLGELGYRAGSSMLWESRAAEGQAQRYAPLARELIDAKCDLVFASGNASARALRDLGRTVPVVFIAVDYDPVGDRIVKSLARPEGHMTGVYAPTAALTVKRFEIALEVLPAAKRFLVLSEPLSRDQVAALKKAADGKGIQLITVDFDKPPYDFARAFDTGRSAGADAVLSFNSPVWGVHRAQLGKLIVERRLAAFLTPSMAEDPAALVAFGINLPALGRRAAELGVRILKGAKPADLPVEEPGEYDLVVNLRTAKTLGVKVPYSVLARATRVIE